MAENGIDRDVWSGLASFAAVAEAGSFTRAAARLGLSPSALSHALRATEARLGVRLLDRTTRSVAPTDAGERLLERLKPAMAEVERALLSLDSRRERPAGRVRVNAHRTAAVHVVLPRLARLAADHPDVSVELAVDDGLADIVAGRFDCGIRHEMQLQRDMIRLRVSEAVPLVFAAAPGYLAGRAAPLDPADLGAHRCISYRYASSGTVHLWEFAAGGRTVERAVPTTFVANDVDVMAEAALAGLGVVCLPLPNAAQHLAAGALSEVLAGFAPVLPPNYLYYPSRRQPSAAFRAFVEAMRPSGGA